MLCNKSTKRANYYVSKLRLQNEGYQPFMQAMLLAVKFPPSSPATWQCHHNDCKLMLKHLESRESSGHLPRKVCTTHNEHYASEAKRDNNDDNFKICGNVSTQDFTLKLHACAMAAYVICIPRSLFGMVYLMMIKLNWIRLVRNPWGTNTRNSQHSSNL